MANHFCAIVFSACLFGLVGCGLPGGNAPVQGIVLFEDSKPVDAGNIAFDDGTYSDRALLTADGSFVVEDGLPPGNYRVTLSSAWGDTPTAKPLVHPRYGSYDTTDLSVEILDQSNELRLTVNRPKR
ncbi:MAG: hypothetical protein ACIALR_11790 [Blastopirellula sp. JB062]